MFWRIVLEIAIFWTALFISIFPLTQILVSIFCAFPLTRILDKHLRMIDGKLVRIKFTATILLWSMFTAFAIYAVVTWVPRYYAITAAFGFGVALIMCIRRCGMNDDNISDYLVSISSYIDPYTQQQWEDCLGKDLFSIVKEVSKKDFDALIK